MNHFFRCKFAVFQSLLLLWYDRHCYSLFPISFHHPIDLFCVICYQVAGYAVGGGHVLHMVCDITIAADNAIFGQTGPKVIFWSILYLTV